MAYKQKNRGVSTPDNRSGVRRDSRWTQAASYDHETMRPGDGREKYKKKRLNDAQDRGNRRARSLPKKPRVIVRLFDGPATRPVFGTKVPYAPALYRGWSPASLAKVFPGIMFAGEQWEAVYNAAEAIKHYQSGGHISGASGWYRENGPYNSTDYPVTIMGVTTYPYREGPFWSITAWPAGKLAGQAITPNVNAAPGGSLNNSKAGLWLRGKIGVSVRYALAESWARNVAQPEGKPFYTAQVAADFAQVNEGTWAMNVLPHAFHVGDLMASPYAPPMWMSPHRVNHPNIDPAVGYEAAYDLPVQPQTKVSNQYNRFNNVGFNLPTGPKSPPKKKPVIGKNPHTNKKPKRGEKERKVKSPVVGILWGAMGTVTEGMDALDAAYDALPKSVKNEKPPKYLWGDKEGTAQWRREQNTPQAKAWKLWRNFDDMDVEKFARNMVRNHVNDMMWGKMGFKGGPWAGPGWEARINGAGVRNYETRGAMDDLGIQGTKFPLDPGKYFADIIFGPQ